VLQQGSCTGANRTRQIQPRAPSFSAQWTCKESKGRLRIIAFAPREVVKAGLAAAWNGPPPQQLGTPLSSRRGGSGVARQSLLHAGPVELGPSSWQ
jgi:hypothetical protein